MSKPLSRRRFLRESSAGAVMGGTLLAGAASPRVARGAAPGANERIRIGVIGCGGRNTHLTLQPIYEAALQHNAEIVAVCDVWEHKREALAARIAQKYGAGTPDKLDDYRRLLERKDIRAVMIATPDHQHCTQLIEAVQAGKDVYVEKPIAMSLDELNRAYDAVKASGAIVQHGTQGRSSAGADTARQFIQAGGLGKLLRVEESRSFYNPYWNGYTGPEKESDTNWKAFLFNRPDRPFDADQHGAWMGYRDFSTGTCGGWMSHFSDLVHFITGCGFPRYAVAHGSIFSPTSKAERTCPDTFTGILEYPEGFATCYTTHFGNGANDYMMFFGTKGIMRTDYPDGWPDGIVPRVSGAGSEHPDKIKEEVALKNNLIEDHWSNWLRCVRERKQPNADMDAGYKQGVAVLMCDMAMAAGRRMTFDPAKREIRPA